MKLSLRVLIKCAALATPVLFIASISRAATTTVTSMKDGFADESRDDKNFGACSAMGIAGGPTGETKQSFVCFDVDLSDGAAATSATLTLQLALRPTNNVDLKVTRWNSGWNEGSGDCGGADDGADLSWVNRPTCTTCSDSVSTTISSSNPADTDIMVNVTSLIPSGQCGDFVLCLKLESENNFNAAFKTKEFLVESARPRLTVEFQEGLRTLGCVEAPALRPWGTIALAFLLFATGSVLILARVARARAP